MVGNYLKVLQGSVTEKEENERENTLSCPKKGEVVINKGDDDSRCDLSAFCIFLWLHLCPSVSLIFSKCLLPLLQPINLLKILLKLDCFPAVLFWSILRGNDLFVCLLVFRLADRGYPKFKTASQFIMKTKARLFFIQKHTHQYLQADFAKCIYTHIPLPLGEKSLIWNILQTKQSTAIY